MKHKDVKKGMKVVPFRKTAPRWSDLKHCLAWSEAKAKKQPFLYVKYFDTEDGWVLGSQRRGSRGDFFRASDFRPYEPPV